MAPTTGSTGAESMADVLSAAICCASFRPPSSREAVRVTNRQMGMCVGRMEPFLNGKGTVFGGWYGARVARDGSRVRGELFQRYVVFSYDSRFPLYFPLYVFEPHGQRWYRSTATSPSRTTSRHVAQAAPHGVDQRAIIPMSAGRLTFLIRHGPHALARRQVLG